MALTFSGRRWGGPARSLIAPQTLPTLHTRRSTWSSRRAAPGTQDLSTDRCWLGFSRQYGRAPSEKARPASFMPNWSRYHRCCATSTRDPAIYCIWTSRSWGVFANPATALRATASRGRTVLAGSLSMWPSKMPAE